MGTSHELDDLKSALFATVSHELRTPLTLILGPTRRLLRDESLTSQQRNDLKTVYRNGNELLDLVNDVLEIARWEAGQTGTDHQLVDLAAMVPPIARQLEAAVNERRARLDLRVAGSVVIEADSVKVRRMLLNLISHTVKVAPPGSAIRVELSGSARQAVIDIEVAHPGPGLPHRPTTGLGLAIAAVLTRLHHGTLTVTDTAEGGACFRLTLPARTVIPGPRTAVPLPSADAVQS